MLKIMSPLNPLLQSVRKQKKKKQVKNIFVVLEASFTGTEVLV